MSIKLLPMPVLKARYIAAVPLVFALCYGGNFRAWGQSESDAPAPPSTPLSPLNLAPEEVSHLQAALVQHDYVAAETLLLNDIGKDPKSLHSASLLAYLGSVYFLNHDYLNAAIAWKKSDSIKMLQPELQFSLAMAYIQIAHPDWATKVLESLAAQDKKNALYVYWLGRLDYDSHHYPQAISHFQQAIALDPTMARAYDNLALCLFYENDNALAIENFKKAIELDRTAQHPSAWPYVNLAETQEFLGDSQAAEANLREAVRLDPQLAVAHYRLGQTLQDQDRLENAIEEFLTAGRLDPSYAEPHIELAHAYNKLGRKDAAQEQVKIYLRLHQKAPGEASRPPTLNP